MRVKKRNLMKDTPLGRILIIICVMAVSYAIGQFVTGNESSAINQFTINSLDHKKGIVLSLSTGSAAISTAISFIPGDAATPIANSFASITNYLVISLAAIYGEKYLLTIIGALVFKVVIPISCILAIVGFFLHIEGFRNLAIKISLIGACMYAVIPTSELLTSKVWSIYETSITETMNDFIGDSEEISNDSESLEESEETEEDVSWFEQIQQYWSQGVQMVENAVDSITDSASELLAKAQNALNNFVEAVAIMIVTSCLFPILVFFIYKWLVSLIVQTDFKKFWPAFENKRIESSK